MPAGPGRQARPRAPFRHRTAGAAAATALGGLAVALLAGTATAQAAVPTAKAATVTGTARTSVARTSPAFGTAPALAPAPSMSWQALAPLRPPVQPFPVAVTVGSATQVITVKASGSYANVTAWQLSNNAWTAVYSTASARIGSKGITNGATRVQDTDTTPTGTYTITQGFGVGANPGTAMPYHQVTTHDWWVEDPTSAYYNQMRTDTLGGFHLTESGVDGSEHLIGYPTQYNNALVINFNMNPAVKGRGAGIFLHDLGPQAGPTAGCVALPAAVMTQIIKWITPSAHPVIAIG
ncbi:L,D-transpeptidase family protein [Streptacidiphilus carbonis]|uniref:L,D-transpeptidase family protein n=1 Tax=Streptacidiphilus carbonis TaxID=105422 RepID=UPI000693DB35|nr:L,D-transpeptidase family protein [Streptacidiphilus carbonis]